MQPAVVAGAGSQLLNLTRDSAFVLAYECRQGLAQRRIAGAIGSQLGHGGHNGSSRGWLMVAKVSVS